MSDTATTADVAELEAESEAIDKSGWIPGVDGALYDPVAAERLHQVPDTFLRLDDGTPIDQAGYGRNCGSLGITPSPAAELFTKDLKAPSEFLRACESEAKIAELEAEKRALQLAGINNAGAPEIRQLLADALESQPAAMTAEQQQSELRLAVNDLIKNDSKYRKCPPAFQQPPQEEFVDRVREIFTSRVVDAEALDAAVLAVLPPVDDRYLSIDVQIASIDKAIESERRDLEKIWYNGFERHFFKSGQAPDTYWQKSTDAVHKNDGSHQQKIAITKIICADFFATWKRRAKLFNEPITINCVAVSTMPEATYKVWHHLFYWAKIRPELFGDKSELKPTKYTPYHFSTTAFNRQNY